MPANEAFLSILADITDTADAVLEAVDGHRAKCLQAGYSAEAAGS